MALLRKSNLGKMDLLDISVFVIFTEVVGLLGGYVSTPAVNDWYLALNKAPFNPPGWVFAPVWFVLYFLMAVAAYIVWKETKKKERNKLLALYISQLFFNFLWSYIFFNLKAPLFAFVDILVLFFLLAYLAFRYFKISRKAGYMMGIYLLWVTFASVLNLWVVLFN